MSDINRQVAGRQSKAAGKAFENMIDAACDYYKQQKVAIIDKTPEPMRVLQPYGERRMGKYIACFAKQAQPDYKGTLCDGTTIIFEAKHTSSDRIKQSVITTTQQENLDGFEQMGAKCYVMVSMGFKKFYRVPWDIFKSMKKLYERKYMKEEDLEPYRIAEKGLILLFLEGIELNGEK